MRENYDVSGPGKYEGEVPMVAWLDAHSECADEDSGDCEAPMGWCSRFAKWILRGDSQGFVSGYKWTTEDQAKTAFRDFDLEYSIWYDDTEECDAR